MAKAPRVSIGVPVYNGEKYLRACLDSILGQTFQDFEIIISDNASTDSTAQICHEYVDSDPRFRYVRQDQNIGAGANHHAVFLMARGEFFMWAAHDDERHPTFLEKAIALLDADPSVVSCFCKTRVIDGDGDLVIPPPPNADGTDFQGLHPEKEAERIRLESSDDAARRFEGVVLQAVRCYEIYGVMRYRLAKTTGGHRPYRIGEKVFLAELSLLGRLVELPEELFFSRWHNDRYSAKSAVKDQQKYVKPKSSGFAMPSQVRVLVGYLGLVRRSELSFYQRIACLAVTGRYLLQFSKLFSIVISGVRGQPTASLTLPETYETVPRARD